MMSNTDYELQERAREEIRELVNNSDSNTLKHAWRELELLGEEPTTVLGYLKMIQIFANMGHSGGSASVFIPTINSLLEQKNLMPLTDDPDEWVHHTAETWGEPGGVWQNVRNGEAFSSDGGKTYTLLSDARSIHGDKPVHTSHDHTKPFNRSVDDFEEETELNHVGLDRKYGHVYTESGNFEENEPLFIFRGKDHFTCMVLNYYRELCKSAGADQKHIESIRDATVSIAGWQIRNGTKIPD